MSNLFEDESPRWLNFIDVLSGRTIIHKSTRLSRVGVS
jgi:hypothetical protein